MLFFVIFFVISGNLLFNLLQIHAEWDHLLVLCFRSSCSAFSVINGRISIFPLSLHVVYYFLFSKCNKDK